MRVVIVMQARMGSTRLPGKSLMDVAGKPLIWHCVERMKHSRKATQFVLATTTLSSDDAIEQFCKSYGVAYYRGHPDDVLDRYYQAARAHKADIVVRVTGDSPLNDPALVDEFVALFEKGGYDYLSNGQEPWMDGFDVEVFSFKALETAWKEATLPSEREHVTPFIKTNSQFKKFFWKNDTRLDGVQCSVDRENDLKLVREIYGRMFKAGKDHTFTYKDVIALFEEEPSLLLINKGAVVNEGYFKSLKEDKKGK